MNELLRQQPTITLRLAMQALQAALEKAEEEQVRISLVVVDASGLPIHSAHMDRAPRPSQDIALNKALTAVGFGIATQGWQARLEKCSEGVRQGLPLQRNMALFGGGAPFLHEGQVIGAIGVSGASEAVDGHCAEAAVERVSALLGH
ncbi:GlcG/HbpS family heme-binding protein [Pseudomonas defluvii]|uniref:GlcG/HbpS family heme-binding protein n=1 Tax=Pseudomonas defluvii TaxID=1876757 RepID=UPI000811A3B2|nr:heme-binding protein [Pseudomonas defluvii]